MKVRAFCALLEDSDLLDPENREQFSRRADACAAGDDAAPLAQWLVEKGWLTPWQAQQLLDGFSTFRLGRYVLLEALGQGGMGAVYKACHPAMGRIVAIKILADARLSNPRAVARFQREMQAAARLDHPNIITAHDAGLIGDQHFLVMEYAEGQDLNAWQKHYGKIPVVWACEFIRQSALGLQHAHERGMVHRDIKPANLLVIWSDPETLPSLKILDLGLARLIAESQPEDREGDVHQPSMEGTVTQDGAIVGTPDYLSPEQIEGKSVDVRSDLFSLGCTFFKILTGQIPFGGKSLMEKIHNRTSRSAPPAMALRTLLPEAPPEVEAIVKKLLERDPAKRFQTPQEVAAALAPFTLRALRAERRKRAALKPAAGGAASAIAHAGGAGSSASSNLGAASHLASTHPSTSIPAAASGVSLGDAPTGESLSSGRSVDAGAPSITPLPPAAWAAGGAGSTSSGTQPTLGANDTPSSAGARPIAAPTPVVWPEGPPRLPEPGVDWRGMPQWSAPENDAAPDDHSREFLRLLARQGGQVQDLPLDGFTPPPPFIAASVPRATAPPAVESSPALKNKPPSITPPPAMGPPDLAPLVSPPPQPSWIRGGEKGPPAESAEAFAAPAAADTPSGGTTKTTPPPAAVKSRPAGESRREPSSVLEAVVLETVVRPAQAPAAVPVQPVQPGRPVALPYPPPSSSSISARGAGRMIPSPRSGLGSGPHTAANHAAPAHAAAGHAVASHTGATPQAAPAMRGGFPTAAVIPLVPQGPISSIHASWGGAPVNPPGSSPNGAGFAFGDAVKGNGATPRYSRLREAAHRRRWWQRNGGAVAFLTAIAVLGVVFCVLAVLSQGHR